MILNRSAGILSPPLAFLAVILPKAHLTLHSSSLALGEWSHHHDYLSHECWRRNETPTLQSGLNLSAASCSCFILYLLHNNLQGKLPSTMIQRLYSAQVRGEITFTLTYLLQLRLCFENFLINLESILSPGLFLLRNQRNILVCKKCSFPMGTNRILSWTSRLQECSALVESLVCKHFSTFLIPSSLHWAEHLVCKNVQPWLRVSFASTSQPSLYLVPYIGDPMDL